MGLYLLLAWVFSPLVLIPATLILAVGNHRLRKENAALKEKQRKETNAGSGLGSPETRDCPVTGAGRYPRPGQEPREAITGERAAAAPGEAVSERLSPTAPRYHAAPAGTLGAAVRVEQRKPAVSPVNLVLAIGAVFILLAGLIFATTTWRHLSGSTRVGLIAMVSALFFGASWFTEAKLGLRQTGRAFYALGCFFLPVTMLAVGYFELLGDWFSLLGEGRYLLGMSAALAAGVAFALGAKRYALPLFAWLSLLGASLSAFLLFCACTPSSGPLSLLLALFCAALVLAAERVQIPPNPFSILTDRLRRYAAFNLLFFGAWSMLTLRGGLPSAFSALLFAVLFLTRLFDGAERENGVPGVLLFTLFWLVGGCRLNASGELGRTALVLAAGSSVVLLLSTLELFREGTRRLLNFSFAFFMIAALALNLPAYFQASGWTAEMLLSTAILTALVSWVGLRRNDRIFLYSQPVFVLAFVNGVSLFLFPQSIWYPFLSALLAAAAFWFSRVAVNRKNGACLRTAVSDILYSSCCLLWGIDLYWLALTAEEALLSIAAVLLFITLVGAMALEETESIRRWAAAWILPHAFLPLLPSIGMLAETASGRELFLGYLVPLGLVAITLLWSAKPFARRFDGPMGLAISLYGPLLTLYSVLFYSDSRSPGLWIFAAYWGVRLFLTLTGRMIEEKKPFGVGFGFCAFAVSLLLASWLTAFDLLWPGVSARRIVCVPASAASVGYLLWVWLRRRKPDCRIIGYLWSLSAISLPLLASAFTLANWGDPTLPLLPMVAGVSFYQFLAYDCLGKQPKTAVLQLLPLLWFYPLLLKVLIRLDFTVLNPVIPLAMIAAFFVVAVLGRILSPGLTREGKAVSLDWFSVINLFAPVQLLLHPSAYWNFSGWLLLGLWFLLFYRRAGGENADRVLLTAALLSLCAACWTQPFWEIPDVLLTEWLLLPLALLVVAVRRWIWPERRRATGALQFGYAVAAVVILGWEAAAYERLADALILGVIALVMLITAFALHLRRWFALSASTLIVLAVYLTCGFWLSLAWWIYLLAVGLLLIGAASLNEFFRQRGENLRERISRLTDRWER